MNGHGHWSVWGSAALQTLIGTCITLLRSGLYLQRYERPSWLVYHTPPIIGYLSHSERTYGTVRFTVKSIR